MRFDLCTSELNSKFTFVAVKFDQWHVHVLVLTSPLDTRHGSVRSEYGH